VVKVVVKAGDHILQKSKIKNISSTRVQQLGRGSRTQSSRVRALVGEWTDGTLITNMNNPKEEMQIQFVSTCTSSMQIFVNANMLTYAAQRSNADVSRIVLLHSSNACASVMGIIIPTGGLGGADMFTFGRNTQSSTMKSVCVARRRRFEATVGQLFANVVSIRP